jgi:hypothetical protein
MLTLSKHKLAGAMAATIALLAVTRIHVRVQTTLTGYEIGRLRNDESRLLEERAALKMQLAKLTSKKHLMLMSDATEDKKSESQRAYAQK